MAVGRPTQRSSKSAASPTSPSCDPGYPTTEALDQIRSAGALLLLAQGQPHQIPNKLYEYLGVRRPILAVVDHGGESHRLLQRAGRDDFILTERSTPSEWDKVIEAAVTASLEPGEIGDGAPLEELRTSRQLSLVVAACQRLLENRKVLP